LFAVTNSGAINSFIVEDQASPDATPFVIDASGNVGIGNASPSFKLVANGAEGGIAFTRAADPAQNMQFHVNGTGNILLSYGNKSLILNQTDSSNKILFQIATTTRMVVDSTGNVGVGSSTPSAILTVTNQTASSSFIVEDQSSDPTPFVIDPSGLVGIGTTSPGYNLSVTGNSGFTGQMNMLGSAANIALGSNYLSGDGGDEGVFVDSAGRVGIGTSTQNVPLVVSVGALAGTPTAMT
jgi:hypothetical protein